MRLGIITYDFYPIIGGQGRHIFEIIRRIECNSEMELIIFSPNDNNLLNHTQIFPGANKFGKNISFSILLFIYIHKIIRIYSLDKLHIHCGPGGLFLLQKLSIPVVVTCHHTYWQQHKYIKGQGWKKIFCLPEKKTYQICDKIICVSKDSKKILTDKYHINSNKITIIPNGVDLNKLYPIEKIEKIDNSLLYVGRIDSRKGIDFLIQAMALVKMQNPNVILFIGGKGKLIPELKKIVEKKDLYKNVKFLGFIPDKDLNKWYNKVKCIVVPSIFEGFGLTVIEAMAAGTPVIGTDVDGIRTIIKNEENGYLVKYGDIELLGNVISSVLANDNDKIIQNGLMTIKSEYNWDVISNEIMEFYKKL